MNGDLTALPTGITEVVLSVVAEARRRETLRTAPVVPCPLTLELADTIGAE